MLTRATLRGTVRAFDVETLYARFGDWPGPVGALATVALLVARRRLV